MAQHDTFDFIVSTPCPNLRLVNIYEAPEREKFSLGLPLELVKSVNLSGVYVKDEDEDPGQMLIVKSKYAPEVATADGDTDRLVKELARLDARNLNPDKVFHGCELEVLIERRLFTPRRGDLIDSYEERGLLDSNGCAVYLLLKRVTVDLDSYRFGKETS